ncbi:MAG: hypothetical protein CMM59_17410 [Rhodospirillaceae bacterium]|nr:hypothetical protein [Rhodospirillaceae bacterium]
MTAELEIKIDPSDCADDDRGSEGANSFWRQSAPLFRARFGLRFTAAPPFELFRTRGYALSSY